MFDVRGRLDDLTSPLCVYDNAVNMNSKSKGNPEQDEQTAVESKCFDEKLKKLKEFRRKRKREIR